MYVQTPLPYVPVHVVKTPCVWQVRADNRVRLQTASLAVRLVPNEIRIGLLPATRFLVESEPPQLLQVGLGVAAIVVFARRPRAAGVLPLGLGGQVEVEARARLDLSHERRRIDVHGTRPIVDG